MNLTFAQNSRWVRGVFTYAAILLIPFSFLIVVTFPDFIIKAKVGISDLAIIVGILVLGISWTLNRSFNHIKLPNKRIHLLMACFFISIINANSVVDFLKDFLQVSLGFYMLYMLLLNTITSKKEINRLINTLIVSTSTLILIATYQYFFAGLHPYFVRSIFADRNLHGIYLAGTLPFVFIKIFHTKSKVLKFIYLLILELAFFSIFSFGHLIASVLAIAFMLLFINKKHLITYGFTLWWD